MILPTSKSELVETNKYSLTGSHLSTTPTLSSFETFSPSKKSEILSLMSKIGKYVFGVTFPTVKVVTSPGDSPSPR